MIDRFVVENYVNKVKDVIDGLGELLSKEAELKDCISKKDIKYPLADTVPVRAVVNEIIKYDCMIKSGYEYTDEAVKYERNIKRDLLDLIKSNDIDSIKGIHASLQATDDVDTQLKELVNNSEALLEAVECNELVNFLITIGFTPTSNEFNKDLFIKFIELNYYSAFIKTFGYVDNIEIGQEILKAVVKYGRKNTLMFIMDKYPEYLKEPKFLFKAGVEARNEEIIELLYERLLK